MAGPEGSSNRGSWAGKMGFILAAAGSAVGLGNLWKFPWMAYKNGGAAGDDPKGAGAFVLVYLVAVALAGLPVMIAEIVVGRRSKRNPVGAFEKLRPGSPWKIVGALGVLTGFVLLSYYVVVAGWTARYLFAALDGSLTSAGADTGRIFGDFLASPVAQVGWLAIFMVATVGVVIGGVSGGIERFAKFLMPALFFMLIWLMIQVLMLDGAGRALTFLFKPDFSTLTPGLVLDGMGQAFFSLSLGMGAMITYGSYLRKKDSIGTSALAVTVLDTSVALMASVVIFGVVFSLDVRMPGDGIGNLFTAIPAIFARLPAGNTLVIIFYLLIVFAALTSTISLLEVVASYFIDERGWSRRKAVLLIGSAEFLVAVPSALSFNVLADAKLFGRTFFELLDYLCANWALPLGGLAITLFAGWVLTSKETQDELATTGLAHKLWKLCVRFAAPIVILAVVVGIILGVGGGE